MNRTKEILEKIVKAIKVDNFSIDASLCEDIVACFIQEIDIASLLYSKEQQLEIRERANKLVTQLQENYADSERFIGVLESMILCVDLVSEIKSWFVNENHWKQVYGCKNGEINEIIKYIGNTGNIDAISNMYIKEYDDFEVPIFFDNNCGMHYVIHKDKKMYFPKDYDANRVAEYYKGIIIEQDSRSPHFYHKEGYDVREGDVIVDAGVAEGNFALEYIDIAKHVYLIEADSSWIEALEETFRGYKDKVTIIKGYLNDEMNGENVSIDGLFYGKDINYIKMDIEGFERLSLLGAENVINQSSNIRCAICSYHHSGDEQWIREYMDGMLMENTTSKGYMIPVWDSGAYHECEVRRGVVFGRK